MNKELLQHGAIEAPAEPRDVYTHEVAGSVEMPFEFFSPYAIAVIMKKGVFNQMQQVSCVLESESRKGSANQLWAETPDDVNPIDYLFERKDGKLIVKPEIEEKINEYSVRFLTSNAFNEDELSPAVGGTYTHMGAKMAKKYGMCLESVYPSDRSLTRQVFEDIDRVPQEAYENASQTKIERYSYNERNYTGYKQSIWASPGNVVSIGYNIRNTAQPQKPPESQPWFGHVNCGFGFSDKFGIYAIGSWGENYGLTLFLKIIDHEKFGKIFVQDTENEPDVIIKGCHLIGHEWFNSPHIFRGVVSWDKKFPQHLEERIKMLKLIRLKGSGDVYAILKNNKYWVTPGGAPNTIYEDGRGVLWPDVPPDKVLEVSEDEFKRYESKGILGGTLIDSIKFFFKKL